MNKGFFITFEGGDGSGKSTQIEFLRGSLEAMELEVMVTREPGGNRISEEIRKILLDPENDEMSPKTEMLLYAAARAQLIDECIRPALDEGKVVICDRFLDSSIAYQGYGRGLGESVETVNGPATEDCMPDLTFFLDIDPESAGGRIRDRGEKKDRIEQEGNDFRARVAQGYSALAEKYPYRIVRIDASAGVEEIAVRIINETMDRIYSR